MTPREVLERHTSREMSEWQAYSQIEVWGHERDDLRFASLMALIANIYRDKDKHPRPFTIEDFLLRFDKQEEEDDGLAEKLLSWSDVVDEQRKSRGKVKREKK